MSIKWINLVKKPSIKVIFRMNLQGVNLPTFWGPKTLKINKIINFENICSRSTTFQAPNTLVDNFPANLDKNRTRLWRESLRWLGTHNKRSTSLYESFKGRLNFFMLALLWRTSFLTPSMVYISAIITYIANYNLSQVGPLWVSIVKEVGLLGRIR